LAGVRVLDLTRVLAGPTCAKTLAEQGADVLKISAEHLPDSGLVEFDTGIGKLSARLDLRTQADRLKELVKQADVFSQSYRPGPLAARGFSPQALAELRPGIVCVSLSAWGDSGSWRSRRGFDSIVQAVSGMAWRQGDGGAPKLLPVSAIDYMSGYLMAFGATVALARRAREGGSWLVRVALERVGRWIVEHGDVPDDEWRAAPADPAAHEYRAEMGAIRYLRPVAQLTATPPRWTRPPVPLGTHAAAWPQRGNA
jgi:crotonobetainyl-CoA:carnitine CoA-transferase CaiB-like acyl-CoA transferase